MFGEKANTWVRVDQSRKRDAGLKEISEPRPGHSTALASALALATDDFAVKGLLGRAMAGNGVVVTVTG